MSTKSSTSKEQGSGSTLGALANNALETRADDAPNSLENSAGEFSTISDFWVGSAPFFESTLFVLPSPDVADPTAEQGEESPFSNKTRVLFFDFAGNRVNQIEVCFLKGEIGVLPLDTFLESCSLTAGFRQGRIVVQSEIPCKHLIALKYGSSEVILAPATVVSGDLGGFVPVLLGDNRSSVLYLLNQSEAHSPIRCRFFMGSRTPEIEVNLAPLSVSPLLIDGQGVHGITEGISFDPLLSSSPLQTERGSGIEPYSSHADTPGSKIGKLTQGYLRISVPKGSRISMQLLEFSQEDRGSRLVSTL